MSHPQPGHVYTLRRPGSTESFGTFEWNLGPPPTFIHKDVNGVVQFSGPYDPEDPVSSMTNGETAEWCGDVRTSDDPNGASIWSNSWQPGWRCTLEY